MLYYGKYNLSDYDIRRFTSLFVKDNFVRFNLMKNQLNQAGYKHVNECLRGITYMAKRYGDEEDVRQTVNMTFFQCITRYQRKDSEKGPIPFSGFLYSYFFYLLKKNVDTFLIDQLGRKSFPLLDDESGNEEDENAQPGFKAPPVEYTLEEMLGTEEINEFWVLGESCYPPFNNLTVQERQLLKWRFVDNRKSSEIALIVTEHPNTVREHLAKVKVKVKEAIIENDMSELLGMLKLLEG
jgi:DNA-directed RNA polymerase specialized sigma24 family protein